MAHVLVHDGGVVAHVIILNNGRVANVLVHDGGVVAHVIILDNGRQ